VLSPPPADDFVADRWPDPPALAGEAAPAAVPGEGEHSLDAVPQANAAAADFDGPAQLDPRRADWEGGGRRPRLSGRGRARPFGTIGSLALHLVPLLLLIDWQFAPAEVVPPIPVKLVMVQPKPPPVPPAPPPPEKKPPPGRLASDSMGNPAAPHEEQQSEEQKEEKQPPAKPSEPKPEKMASALPPPRGGPVPLPKPSEDNPPQQIVVPPPPPKPLPPVRVIRGIGPVPPRAVHFGELLGPVASRDEYLAYCNSLIRRNFGMLPRSLIGDRSGKTVLTLLVRDDGTIGGIAVLQSSGYRDIDERVVQMVAAVRRFPPVPQWFQGASTMLEYELPFPQALERN
jgi:TonB family protein